MSITLILIALLAGLFTYWVSNMLKIDSNIGIVMGVIVFLLVVSQKVLVTL
jgi:hypothetical protein